jgi:YidC/Oxa1 family membrane protein insertase
VESGPQTVTRETGVFRLTFSRVGGVLTSIQLKKYKNLDGTQVDMVRSTDDQYPFEVSFGDYKESYTRALFNLKETVNGKQDQFEFWRTFTSLDGQPFILRKTYIFSQDEYLMEMRVSVENTVNEIPRLSTGQYAYTLSIGPQIGPAFKLLDGRSEYRNFIYFADGKRKDLGALSGQVKEYTNRVTWIGIMGKYFTILAVPDATQYRYVADARKTIPGFDKTILDLERPTLQAAKSTDIYRIYIGPKTADATKIYNDATKNSFGIADLKLDSVIYTPFLIGWLAQALNWLLNLFHMLIPNYGIAIVILTLLIKLVFLPMTFKSSEATARMQSLNPKIAEIRERLKGKPDKMNQEIALLYRKEKVNPLAGCLPLILQLPILWGIYSMLNDNFALRGAMFIPGWIPDLSSPEFVWDFAPFAIPILNWSSLRLLPFLMLGTQFLQTRFATPQDQSQQGAQMKIFTYVLPAFFFFILYNMPSGLVLYWTVQNILSIFQQLYVNYVNKKKKLAAASVEISGPRRR